MTRPEAARTTGGIALAGMILLILASAFAALHSGGGAVGSWVMLLALTLPLLLPLRGMLRGHRRTYAWATLCLLPCLVYGLTEVIANPSARGAAAVVLFLCLAEFVALVVCLRATRPAAAINPDRR